MLYRSYRRGDSEAMFALDELCFGPPFRFTARAMLRFATAANASVVLAEEDGVLAGFIIVHVQSLVRERVAYVVTLDVREEWRRSGLGSELMRRAADIASNQGCVAVILHVFTRNETAICFYERLGFVAIGNVEGFYQSAEPGERLDALLYRKSIADHSEAIVLSS